MDKCKSKELKNADACYDLNHHHFGDILRRCTGSKMRGLPATTAEIRQIIQSSKVFMQTAVLVIDMQQGLCEGPDAAHDCLGTIERINALTQRARAAGVPVFFIQHESSAGYLEHGSPEWQLATGLQVQADDRRVRKTTPDAFLRTELNEALQALRIQDLVVCGMHSEFCVDTTTCKALALGYPVVLVSDAHTSAGNAAIGPQQVIAHHNATLTNISSFGPRVTAVAHDALRFGA